MNLSELKKIAGAATPGPWEHNGSGAYICFMKILNNDILQYISSPKSELNEFKYDAQFIATFNPTLVLELISRLEKCRSALDLLYSSTLNEMVSRGLPAEFNKDSALGIASTALKELGREIGGVDDR